MSREPINPHAPYNPAPPANHGIALAFLAGFAALAIYVVAQTVHWPLWLAWMGPIGALLWEIRVLHEELRRLAAAWNAKLVAERDSPAGEA